jgi:hypothetical protein
MGFSSLSGVLAGAVLAVLIAAAPAPAVTIGVGPAAPGVITPPSVTGDLIVGHVVTCSPGTWSGDPTFTYQWRKDLAAIPAATNPTYALTPADGGHDISCVITATNSVGSTVQWGWADALVLGVAADHAPPATSGQPIPGGTLSCSSGFWLTGTLVVPTFSYAWLRDGKPIRGAVASTRRVRFSDAGHVLSCRVTASDAAGSASAASAPVRVSASICLSTRRILLHLLPSAAGIRSAAVVMDGRHALIRRVGSRLVATIDLSGVRAVLVTVQVRITTRAGRTLHQTHVYRACPGV